MVIMLKRFATYIMVFVLCLVSPLPLWADGARGSAPPAAEDGPPCAEDEPWVKEAYKEKNKKAIEFIIETCKGKDSGENPFTRTSRANLGSRLGKSAGEEDDQKIEASGGCSTGDCDTAGGRSQSEPNLRPVASAASKANNPDPPPDDDPPPEDPPPPRFRSARERRDPLPARETESETTNWQPLLYAGAGALLGFGLGYALFNNNNRATTPANPPWMQGGAPPFAPWMGGRGAPPFAPWMGGRGAPPFAPWMGGANYTIPRTMTPGVLPGVGGYPAMAGTVPYIAGVPSVNYNYTSPGGVGGAPFIAPTPYRPYSQQLYRPALLGY